MYGHERNSRMVPDMRISVKELVGHYMMDLLLVTSASSVTATFLKDRTKMNLNGLEIGLTKL